MLENGEVIRRLRMVASDARNESVATDIERLADAFETHDTAADEFVIAAGADLARMDDPKGARFRKEIGAEGGLIAPRGTAAAQAIRGEWACHIQHVKTSQYDLRYLWRNGRSESPNLSSDGHPAESA